MTDTLRGRGFLGGERNDTDMVLSPSQLDLVALPEATIDVGPSILVSPVMHQEALVEASIDATGSTPLATDHGDGADTSAMSSPDNHTDVATVGSGEAQDTEVDAEEPHEESVPPFLTDGRGRVVWSNTTNDSLK